MRYLFTRLDDVRAFHQEADISEKEAIKMARRFAEKRRCRVVIHRNKFVKAYGFYTAGE